MSHPIICLTGPTASGKSAFAMKLSELIPVEIISVDSAMVYRDMDIGTHKPTEIDRKQVPHHLIDIRDPSEPYSAAEFIREAKGCIDAIIQRGRIPLLVGGTLFYFHALLHGLPDLPGADPQLREEILRKAQSMGWPAMHEALKAVNENAAKRIHPNDQQRIQRAWEIHLSSKNSTNHLMIPGLYSMNEYGVRLFACMPAERRQLHEHIALRFDDMLKHGLVEEVKKLWDRGDLHDKLPAIRSVGYRHVWGYLNQEYDCGEMRERAIAATRQLAKRQMTWIRGLAQCRLLENTHLASIQSVVQSLER